MEEKTEKLYYAISEAAAMLNVNPSVLRFWEKEFEDIRPKKSRKGRRLYTQQDIEVLKNIYYLVKVRKFTLQGAKEKLKGNATAIREQAQVRETLGNLRNFLADLSKKLDA